MRRSGALPQSLTALFALALSQCGGANDDGHTGALRQSILGGVEGGTLESPLLYLQGPEGTCTAVLVAPQLAVTARHCVAKTSPGAFSCTASGDLVLTGNGAGQIGTDVAPGSLAFFSAAQVAAGTAFSANPDAVGASIVSTQTPTACRDDLAFVVLDRAITGFPPAAVRIDGPTVKGERVSVWGYGLTEHVNDTLALRVRADVDVLGVGPDTAASTTQMAPVRSVRIGPVTCQGDSGGAMLSATTGALIAIVSIGNQASSTGPYCNTNVLSETLGPRIGAYRALVLQAFQAAGASPIAEETPDAASAVEAPSSDDAMTRTEAASDAASEPDLVSAPDTAAEGAQSPEVRTYRATGASCATGLTAQGWRGAFGMLAIAFALTVAAIGRRKSW